MPRSLSRLEQLAFAQLVDLSHDRNEQSRFAPNGSFVQARRGDVSYWYYQGYTRSRGDSPVRTRIYVGRVGDPEVERIRREHEGAHARYRERRRIAASLRRAGLSAPAPFEGAVIAAIDAAGLFAAGAIMVGSMAYQTYPGLIGCRLDDALMQTGDVDLASPRHAAVRLAASGKSAADLEVLLRDIDPTFEPIFDRTHPTSHLGYRNKASYKIEFLTSSGARRAGAPAAVVPLAGFGGVSAQPLRFLEFLLDEPVRSLVLHDDGIPVLVPDPARFAVHKLIVAHMRERVADGRGTLAATRAKVAKDVAQTTALVVALREGHRGNDVGLAWENAWQRGPKWREHLRGGLARLAPDACESLAACVLETAGPFAWPKGLGKR